jgi:hypothetical protein
MTPHHTTPHHNTPHHITPHHTAPHHITPHHTAPHRTTPQHTQHTTYNCNKCSVWSLECGRIKIWPCDTKWPSRRSLHSLFDCTKGTNNVTIFCPLFPISYFLTFSFLMLNSNSRNNLNTTLYDFCVCFYVCVICFISITVHIKAGRVVLDYI